VRESVSLTNLGMAEEGERKLITALVARDLQSTGVGAWNVVCNGWVPRERWPLEVWRRVFGALAMSDGISKVEVTAEALERMSESPRRGYESLLEALRAVDDRASRGESRFEGLVVRFAAALMELRRLEGRGRGGSLRAAKGAVLGLSEALSSRTRGLDELRLREFWDAESEEGFVTQLAELVARNRSLSKVEVACTFSAGSLGALASAVAAHPRLREVEIGARAEMDDVVDDEGALAALVASNRVLQKLTLYDDPLSHAGFAAMCEALERNETLTSLTLGFAGGEGASPALSRLCATLTGPTSRLATLHIADCGLPASRLVDYLSEALPAAAVLRELKVGFFRVGPSVARLASSVAHNTSLVKLVVWTVPRDLDGDLEPPDFAVDDSVVDALADSLAANRTLRDLSFDNCDVSDAAASALVDVLLDRRNTTLRALDLDVNRVVAAGAAAKLAALLARPDSPLASLSLRRGRHLGDDGARAIANALATSCAGLTSLDLSFCGLSDAAAFAIADLLRANACPLASLALTHNNIGDDGARELARALCAARNTTLARLDLSFNDIDPNVTAFNSAEAFADHFNAAHRRPHPPPFIQDHLLVTRHLPPAAAPPPVPDHRDDDRLAHAPPDDQPPDDPSHLLHHHPSAAFVRWTRSAPFWWLRRGPDPAPVPDHPHAAPVVAAAAAAVANTRRSSCLLM